MRLADYFPLTPNVFSQYAGTGNEFVPMTVYVDFVWPDMIQMAYDNGGTQIHKLYAVRNGQVQVLQTKPELYVREDLSKLTPLANGEILLKEPLVVGTSWPVSGETRQITGIRVPVTTPAGAFDTIEVTTRGSGSITRQYYGAGAGLVRMTVAGPAEITQTLEKRTLNAVRTDRMAFYYPRMTTTDIAICYKEVDVESRTNEGIREILTKYLQTPLAANLLPVLPWGAAINSVSSDLPSGIAMIDLSSNFVISLNAGTPTEAAVLRCLVNAVGHAYGVTRVIVTLAGKPYESGHIAMKPGEAFSTNYQGMVRLP